MTSGSTEPGPGPDERQQPSVAGSGTESDAGAEEWRHVHRATPFLRGWLFFVAAAGFVLRQLVESPGSEGLSSWGLRWSLTVAGTLVAVVLAAMALMYLSWRFTRYRVAPGAVYVQQGVLFRQQRQARLDRVQSIDIVQPLAARIFGLAQLRFHVAGGPQAQVDLAYLRLEEARDLRAALLAGAAGLETTAGEQVPAAPERPVLEVGAGRVLASLLLTPWGLLVPLLVIGLVVLTAVLRQPAVLTAAVPGLLAGVSALWSRFGTEANFRLAESRDGIRITSGLLQTNAQTVPPGRIQAIGLSQPLLWRAAGWWRVRVNLASAADGTHGGSGVLLPVGTRDDVLAVLALALPDPGTTDGRALVRGALTGRDHEAGFTAVPRRARWLDPLAYRRAGFRVTRTAVVVRAGRLTRRASLVPHARTQSLQLRQGPLQRRLALASVRLHSTVGPVQPEIPHLAVEVARDFLDHQSERARGARRTAGPERWMRTT